MPSVGVRHWNNKAILTHLHDHGITTTNTVVATVQLLATIRLPLTAMLIVLNAKICHKFL